MKELGEKDVRYAAEEGIWRRFCFCVVFWRKDEVKGRFGFQLACFVF